jgi:hypothetical protein
LTFGKENLIMTGLEILAAILSIGDSLLSIGVKMRGDGSIDAEDALNTYFTTAGNTEREILGSFEGRSAVYAVLTINPETLKQYKKRIEETIIEHQNVIANAIGADGMKKALERAGKIVCEFLDLIRMQNRGKLPGRELVRICHEYNCGNCS